MALTPQQMQLLFGWIDTANPAAFKAATPDLTDEQRNQYADQFGVGGTDYKQFLDWYGGGKKYAGSGTGASTGWSGTNSSGGFAGQPVPGSGGGSAPPSGGGGTTPGTKSYNPLDPHGGPITAVPPAGTPGHAWNPVINPYMFAGLGKPQGRMGYVNGFEGWHPGSVIPQVGTQTGITVSGGSGLPLSEAPMNRNPGTTPIPQRGGTTPITPRQSGPGTTPGTGGTPPVGTTPPSSPPSRTTPPLAGHQKSGEDGAGDDPAITGTVTDPANHGGGSSSSTDTSQNPAWTIWHPGAFNSTPFMQTYGGQQAPFSGLDAQIASAMSGFDVYSHPSWAGIMTPMQMGSMAIGQGAGGKALNPFK